VALVGPTGSGKTLVALIAASLARLEVISMDSRQVYRGMDIGTAKPSPGELARVPHHLIDLVEPTGSYSAGRFARDAEDAVGLIRARGYLPLLAGGTGLYLRAFAEGLIPVPSDPATRRGLRDEAASLGTASLHRRLAAVDPEAAAAIHPHDGVRITRALEFYLLTGSTFTELRRRQASRRRPLEVFGLEVERGILYRRLDLRFLEMMGRGLAGEVESLRAAGLSLEHRAMHAPGYREILLHLSGRFGLEEAVVQAQRATRNLAKRQMSWFRSVPGITWLRADTSTDIAHAATLVAEALVAAG
jgi:tRNA dimethylallyltransferase